MAKNPRFDGDRMFSGFVLGLLAGALWALFKGPRVRVRLRLPDMEAARQRIKEAKTALRDTLENVTPSDPVDNSIAEGKEAARRRRAELGLNDG
ncbi:MAG: hypothetical protein ACOCZH_00705 [Phototrophicaceae bacterium]